MQFVLIKRHSLDDEPKKLSDCAIALREERMCCMVRKQQSADRVFLTPKTQRINRKISKVEITEQRLKTISRYADRRLTRSRSILN
ncbi:hypothetical protein [Allocoleopsis franciscana]|uniref:hypothetical protein n=1 Tax=Allocoleopsis franciscana TaxID=2886352 RepID=UPI0002E70772|nr:hypothetical protein [Allocoleopsis franciscana]